ncbi:hypothetical protein Scep_000833 [Stephania cephalantha]|uniref:Uncharacterized protein n=1 Tax=Stephania cephalantha TaxID=152367 RepID=A0AAP0L6T2_9MAGN
MELQCNWCWHSVPNNSSTARLIKTPFGFITQKLESKRRRASASASAHLSISLKSPITANVIETSSSSSGSSSDAYVPNYRFNRPEPFGGKSGSVSFYGLTHQAIEQGKLVSSPFRQGTKGSPIWVLAPVAFISSLVLPQFFLSTVIEASLTDEILAEILFAFSSEAIFYFGLSIFLLVTDHVQRPYLEFHPKQWGLITGLNGYLTSAFFTMGFKVFLPLFALFVTWPPLGLGAVIAVAPFLIGCAAQFGFEAYLQKRRSSCWPLVPIIFEVYRLYQLTKAAHFIEKLMFSMNGIAVSTKLLERRGALVAMMVCVQVLGVVCLWSLMTFLLRLFPSRPVAENY